MSPDSASPHADEGSGQSANRTVTVVPSSPPGTGTFFAPTGDSSTNGAGNTPLPPAPPGYELLGEIGRGGMGVVYKARQNGLNRLVALKVILAGGHASATQRSRFLHEAEAVAAITHSGIVGVYEFGTWESQPYMALEFCPGGSLADKLKGTPLPGRDATILIERLALAVAVAHDKGIVHRDLKPANVLIASDGTPKIGDFGVAKIADTQEGLTATGAIMGTPSYMAPEQARGDAKKVGPPADVYALGAVLYECLTGRPPFKGASPAETILQTLNQEPVSLRALNPLVPVDLETVCLKCLDKDAARRYTTAKALADDLHRFLEGLPVIARPVGPMGRMQRWVRRNQVVTGLLGVIVLAVLTGTTATYIKYRDEAAQRDVAVQEAAAKERALGELRNTLAALEKKTEEQKQTLMRLTEEKAASEDAFLRGLLRPLREHTNFQVTLEEAKVLFELSALPEERLRFRFVSRGLESPHGAATLAAWPWEVASAVVGLDREAAVRLREQIGRVLKDEKTSPGARVACVLLAGELPADDKEFDRLVARIMVDLMVAVKDDLILSQLSDGLASFSSRLNPQDSMMLAKSLLERLIT
ncbi:MAG TPA: serine/threonine-protein kinase, partial [Gemmata sp.]|nr:serine/threonine-protein kinase [Gemmata sp.]